MKSSAKYLVPVCCTLLAAAALLSGCSRKNAPLADNVVGPSLAGRSAVEGATTIQIHPVAPSPLANVTVEGTTLSLWPYTGASFDPAFDPIDSRDPMNLIFVGDVDPLKIREVLLGLDGDRTSFGFPNAFPFNERWADAHGSAQTAYADPAGWVGSVVQLRLGQYGPVRIHLRLFRTGAPFGDTGTWTVGGVHFELMIPGTAQHQALAWNIARDVVTADLARSGFLVAPPSMTGEIYSAPTYRTIPGFIWDQLPPELKALGGPDIPSDGKAAVFHLEGTPAPKAGTFTQQFTIPFAQMIPKPFCDSGPYDMVYVEGPLDLSASATVDADGRYTMDTRYTGKLTITPMNVTVNPPVPAGTPYTAMVSEIQTGQTGGGIDAVFSRSTLLGTQAGSGQLRHTDLKVSSAGVQEYRFQEMCLEPTP
ncbi:MAG: hypothetical protein ACM3PF_12885 [Bacteroidota bacterium]